MSRKALVPIELPADPTLALEAATKQYVDRGAVFLNPVRVASTGSNITLSGTQTIDGIGLSAGDRVLVKDQSTNSFNGIYVVSAGAWSRASDFNSSPIAAGTKIRVTEGSTNRLKTYTLMVGINDLGTDTVTIDVLTHIDGGGSLQYPSPVGIGHLYYDTTDNTIAVWDGTKWARTGQPIICTSTTRPTFINDGLLIYETDTHLAYIRSGTTWVSFGSGPEVYEEGVPVVTDALGLNFVGAGVTATNDGVGNATVTIPGGGSALSGSMTDWDSGATLPSGYLWCDGTTVSRTTYAALFAVIGTRFNTGGEAGTDFRLPLYLKQFADADVTNACTAATGYSIASQNLRVRSGWVYLWLSVTRTGSNIAMNIGDHANQTIATITAPYWPEQNTGGGGVNMIRTVNVLTGGTISITAGMADSGGTTGNLNTNDTVSATYEYPIAQASTLPSIRKIIKT